jgi:hypothetical protein
VPESHGVARYPPDGAGCCSRAVAFVRHVASSGPLIQPTFIVRPRSLHLVYQQRRCHTAHRSFITADGATRIHVVNQHRQRHVPHQLQLVSPPARAPLPAAMASSVVSTVAFLRASPQRSMASNHHIIARFVPLCVCAWRATDTATTCAPGAHHIRMQTIPWMPCCALVTWLQIPNRRACSCQYVAIFTRRRHRQMCSRMGLQAEEGVAHDQPI